MTKRFKKPFREPIVLSSREVLSPQDKRDFIMSIPKVKKLPMKYSWDVGLPILDQKTTDLCTAFCTFRSFAQHLSGMKREDFLTSFHDQNADYMGKFQMSFFTKNFWKKLLRNKIWLWKGKNMRAALWNINHGVKLKDGSIMMVKEYHKCIPKTPEDLCKYLYFHGSLLAGMVLRGAGQKFWFTETGRYQGTGDFIGGHAIVISGFNRNEKVFYIDNSWGEDWGQDGRGEIPFDRMDDLREFWLLKGCKFQVGKYWRDK